MLARELEICDKCGRDITEFWCECESVGTFDLDEIIDEAVRLYEGGINERIYTTTTKGTVSMP